MANSRSAAPVAVTVQASHNAGMACGRPRVGTIINSSAIYPRPCPFRSRLVALVERRERRRENAPRFPSRHDTVAGHRDHATTTVVVAGRGENDPCGDDLTVVDDVFRVGSDGLVQGVTRGL